MLSLAQRLTAAIEQERIMEGAERETHSDMRSVRSRVDDSSGYNPMREWEAACERLKLAKKVVDDLVLEIK